MGKSRWAFAWLCLTLVSPAWAVRSTALFPVDMDTIHGGYKSSIVCGSADMLPAAFMADGGVFAAYHTYLFSFRNLSTTIPQTVSVILEAQSSMDTRYSATEAAPVSTGPSRTVTSDNTYTFVLGPGAVSSVAYAAGCSRGSCWMERNGSVILGSHDPLEPNACDPANVASTNVCFGLRTHMNFRLSILEDRGAVLASLSTLSHRACGWKDKYQQPPPYIVINGGRPF